MLTLSEVTLFGLERTVKPRGLGRATDMLKHPSDTLRDGDLNSDRTERGRGIWENTESL